jgi:hypothetical protein
LAWLDDLDGLAAPSLTGEAVSHGTGCLGVSAEAVNALPDAHDSHTGTTSALAQAPHLIMRKLLSPNKWLALFLPPTIVQQSVAGGRGPTTCSGLATSSLSGGALGQEQRSCLCVSHEHPAMH